MFIKGLALINGTQFITSMGIEALERAHSICDAANAIAALTLEVLKGSTRAFDEGKHSHWCAYDSSWVLLFEMNGRSKFE